MENLFKCPDCGNEVSHNAKVCPKCGNNKIKKQITQKEWENMEPKKKKRLMIIGIGILSLLVIAGIFGPKKPSACDCIDNLDLGYYDALSKKDREMRDKCNEAYAGRATLYIECKKEKGQ
jgi:uncharacterized membrane protein YvbJ